MGGMTTKLVVAMVRRKRVPRSEVRIWEIGTPRKAANSSSMRAGLMSTARRGAASSCLVVPRRCGRR